MTLQQQGDLWEKLTHGDFDRLFGEYPSSWQSWPDSSSMESRLAELETKVSRSIDIGLENRTLLENLTKQMEQAAQNGVGAIHSLDNGRVQLAPPLFYNLQVFDDEVLAGIDQLSAYGVGASEPDAVAELQKELWELFEELDQLPQDELGVQLVQTLRVLKSRIKHNALDA